MWIVRQTVFLFPVIIPSNWQFIFLSGNEFTEINLDKQTFKLNHLYWQIGAGLVTFIILSYHSIFYNTMKNTISAK